jgi:hypothetical protein
MRILLLLLILASARQALGQYLLVMKKDGFNSHNAEAVCISERGDSLAWVLDEYRRAIPLDTVKYLSFRDRKSWWPYLLAASLVGVSTYAYFHFASRDDAMYTAEGKARFAGFLWGGIALWVGAMLKEPIETRTVIDLRWGINRTEAFISCTF